jgi:hypothetical protein
MEKTNIFPWLRKILAGRPGYDAACNLTAIQKLCVYLPVGFFSMIVESNIFEDDLRFLKDGKTVPTK